MADLVPGSMWEASGGAWSGVVEVIDDQTYIHHADWPQRSTRVGRSYGGASLYNNVISGYWRPTQWEHLQLDEGL